MEVNVNKMNSTYQKRINHLENELHKYAELLMLCKNCSRKYNKFVNKLIEEGRATREEVNLHVGSRKQAKKELLSKKNKKN